MEMHEAACDADADAVNITREPCEDDPEKYKAKLADRLHQYSASLNCSGTYEAACDAKAQAVTILQIHGRTRRSP